MIIWVYYYRSGLNLLLINVSKLDVKMNSTYNNEPIMFWSSNISALNVSGLLSQNLLLLRCILYALHIWRILKS